MFGKQQHVLLGTKVSFSSLVAFIIIFVFLYHFLAFTAGNANQYFVGVQFRS